MSARDEPLKTGETMSSRDPANFRDHRHCPVCSRLWNYCRCPQTMKHPDQRMAAAQRENLEDWAAGADPRWADQMEPPDDD